MQENRSNETVHLDEDGMVFENVQVLNGEFWDELRSAQEDWKLKLDGYTPVATIPEALVDHMIRRGFPFWQASAQEIINELKKTEYAAFITSPEGFTF